MLVRNTSSFYLHTTMFCASLLLGLGLATRTQSPSDAPSLHPRQAVAVPADSLATRLRALLTESAGRFAHGWQLVDAPAARAFYAARRYAPVWTSGPQLTAPGRVALALLAQADDYGLLPWRYHAPALRALADSLPLAATPARQLARQTRFEALLTDGLLRFVRHLRRGQLHPFEPSPLESKNDLFAPEEWVANSLTAQDFAAAVVRCQPPQREYQQLQQALARWRRQALGPDSLARRRQAQQLALNLERWRWVAFPDSDYVLVNLPAYALEVVRAGQVQQTHRLVIGRPTMPTPTLDSRLTSFTLAPEWRVPHSIAVCELLPHLQAGTDFVAENNYAIYDAQGRPVDPVTVNWRAVKPTNFSYSIRQNPGCGNALGNIIFRFANPYGVYLHDTSAPQDFERSYRALGHGCMRVEHPLRLAAYLLGPDSTQAALPAENECEALPQSRSFYLKRPLPLYVRYAMCAVVAGQLRFYDDVYGQDAVLRRQLYGPRAQF